MPSDKAGLAFVLAGLKKKPAEPEGDEPGPGGDLETIAGEILQAIEGKDARALAGALQSFWTVVDDDSGMGEGGPKMAG